MAGAVDRFELLVPNSAPVKIERIQHPLLEQTGIELAIRRDDLIHPQISGNKWYKLLPLLQSALAEGACGLASMGGAFSNHLHALAYAGHRLGIPTVGLIRGEICEPLNPSLADMSGWGMRLITVPRTLYRQRHERDLIAEYVTESGYFAIAEGGASTLAIQGCYQWGQSVASHGQDYDLVCLACGTGTGLAGLVPALAGTALVLGFSALRDQGSIAARISKWLRQSAVATADWQLISDFAGPGFGHLFPELLDFLEQWPDYSKVPLDPVYTGKMMFGLFEMIKTGRIRPGQRVLAIHSGGIQGARGMAMRFPQHASVIRRASGLVQ